MSRSKFTKKGPDGKLLFDWLAVLDQDQVWVDKDGREKQVKYLDDGYLRNILAFMDRRAKGILWWYEMTFTVGPFADDGILHAIECEFREANRDPVAWLRAFPLMQAMQARLDLRAEMRFAQSDQARHMRWLEDRDEPASEQRVRLPRDAQGRFISWSALGEVDEERFEDEEYLDILDSIDHTGQDTSDAAMRQAVREHGSAFR